MTKRKHIIYSVIFSIFAIALFTLAMISEPKDNLFVYLVSLLSLAVAMICAIAAFMLGITSIKRAPKSSSDPEDQSEKATSKE